ncbi:hypothetical protein ACFSJU_12570 [Paradesertivirga mongoliensis]|uniref:Uncharacterized protein n=1 Tax=Paradesertivirga mongoliensis TaxID=2100740 RepID=A0ABW4ZNT1_9SPHI|nr:hypothetical protein [Pedobacter mongoliensis]
MERNKIIIRGIEYLLEPGLHPGYYSVTSRGKSAMLGKTPDGLWEFSLQSSDPLNISADELGREIEKRS